MDQRLKNKEWRVNHLYKITNKSKQLVRFQRNPAQKDFKEHAHTRNIVLKSRQLGFTTEEAIDGLDDVLFERNFDMLFIAQDLKTAGDIFDNKINLAWEHFPLKDLYTPDLESARRLKLGFGDGTYSSITVDSSGRAGTFHRLHITEFATVAKNYPARAKEIIKGSIPAVPTGGRVDIESTAQESEGLFYDMFWEAWDAGEPKHEEQFKAHFYNWQWDYEDLKKIVPEPDLPYEFREYQKKYKLSDIEITYYYLKWLSLHRDWDSLRKEYPTTPQEAFEGAGVKLFDLGKLSNFEIKSGVKKGEFVVYEPYEIGHRYGIGCDVAEGVGQDSSTIVMWDFTPAKPKVVVEYADNNIPPDTFAHVIKNIAEQYERPIVAVERNNHGHTTISKLREIYPERFIYKDEKERYGWDTNVVSKPQMFYDLSTAVNDELIDIPSRRIVSEMRRYDKANLKVVKFREDSTQHYDLLIGAIIGFQMKSEFPKTKKKSAKRKIKRTGIHGI